MDEAQLGFQPMRVDRGDSATVVVGSLGELVTEAGNGVTGWCMGAPLALTLTNSPLLPTTTVAESPRSTLIGWKPSCASSMAGASPVHA